MAYQLGATSGYRNDADAGLTLVGCRYYDAQVGRFITRDTYLNQKPYAYCDGDPVNAIDPSGHVGIVSGTVGAGVAVVVGIIAIVAIEIVSGGTATPIVIGIVSGVIGGAAGGATTAGMDGTSIPTGAIEGGIMGGVMGGVGPVFGGVAKTVAQAIRNSLS